MNKLIDHQSIPSFWHDLPLHSWRLCWPFFFWNSFHSRYFLKTEISMTHSSNSYKIKTQEQKTNWNWCKGNLEINTLENTSAQSREYFSSRSLTSVENWNLSFPHWWALYCTPEWMNTNTNQTYEKNYWQRESEASLSIAVCALGRRQRKRAAPATHTSKLCTNDIISKRKQRKWQTEDESSAT